MKMRIQFASWNEYASLKHIAVSAAKTLNQQGVWHRDPHVDNIIVTADGQGHLIDFGRSITTRVRGDTNTGRLFDDAWWVHGPDPPNGFPISVGGRTYRIVRPSYRKVTPMTVKRLSQDTKGRVVWVERFLKMNEMFRLPVESGRSSNEIVYQNSILRKLEVMRALGRLEGAALEDRMLVYRAIGGETLESFYERTQDGTKARSYMSDALKHLRTHHILVGHASTDDVFIDDRTLEARFQWLDDALWLKKYESK
jgi:hypothetical protein